MAFLAVGLCCFFVCFDGVDRVDREVYVTRKLDAWHIESDLWRDRVREADRAGLIVIKHARKLDGRRSTHPISTAVAPNGRA